MRTQILRSPLVLVLASLLLIAALPACGDTSGEDAPPANNATPGEDTPPANNTTPELTAGQQRFGESFPGDLLDNVPARENPSQAPAADIQQATRDQHLFARDLFAISAEQHPGENAFFSPFSVSAAFAMALPAANNPDAIRRNLRFSLPDGQLHPANNGLQLEILKHSGARLNREGEPVVFNLANGVWLDSTGLTDEEKAARIEAGDTSGIFGRYYDAPIALLDMQADPVEAERLLNAWVSDRTNGLIPELLQGNINQDTFFVSINALYFKAAWSEPFSERLTAPDTFTLEDGTAVQTPTFHAPNRPMQTYQRDGLEAVAISYTSPGLEMVLLMPPAGELDALVDALTPELLEEVAAGLSHEQLIFAMPRFEVEAMLDLTELLEDPYSSANHHAVIRIDEKGTEAAAATVVEIGDNNAPEPIEPERELKIDRPFLFLIWDRPSRTVAFMGKVVDPR